MSKAEERALEVFPEDIQLFVESQEEPGKWLPVDENAQLRYGYKRGYEQAEKDTVAEVEKWLKANFHHRNCWNADEFCISLRTHFGIEK